VQTVFTRVPQFCRVTATLTPSSDSDIKVEVWLPASGWNGKFQAVGNGGWNGNIPYGALANAVIAGYATAGTDTGHAGNTAEFALGHPEKLIDFGYRAVHEMTVKAKSIVDAFYGSAPTLSIWNGCSQGGRQGITAAVRYPADFDGVVVGAPAVNFVHLHAGRVAMNRAVNATPASAIPASKYPFINQAVLAACDAKDGVTDGVLENPGACAFDPRVLQCSGESDNGCLTAAQVESATRMYAGAKHPITNASILPGLAPGAELERPRQHAATQPRGRFLQVRVHEGQELGCFAVQCQHGHRRCDEHGPGRCSWFDECGPPAVLRARRKAAHVPRLVRFAGDAL
jgi:feruloyl esterase